MANTTESFASSIRLNSEGRANDFRMNGALQFRCGVDLIRAGQLLKLEVLDHVVMGHGQHSSLRQLGHFL